MSQTATRVKMPTHLNQGEQQMPHKKAPPVRHDDPAMRGQRARNAAGALREKRGDTLVRTIEQQYHVDFGVRGDMHLDTLLEQKGMKSLSELLAKTKKP